MPIMQNPMQDSNNLPIISNYNDLIAFNNSLPQTSQPLDIKWVSYAKDKIKVNGEKVGIDRFLYNYVLNPRKLIGEVNRLKDYDFSRLYLLLHPESFFEEFQAYVNNLILLGLVANKKLTLWDFEIEIDGDDITITEFKNTSAEEVVIPYFITRIGNNAFSRFYEYYNIRKLIVQEGSRLKSLGKAAFYGCKYLKEINLPDTLTEIGYACFENTALKSVILPDNLITISVDAFKWCKNLKNVVIPDTVNVIRERTFVNCLGLKSITIGKGVKKIGEAAFCNCISLKDITILGDVEKIGEDAFSHTDIEELVLPKSVKASLFEYAKKRANGIFNPISVESALDAVKGTIAKGCDNLKSVEFV